MSTFLALHAVRAEAGQVESAEGFTDVFFAAGGAEGAEAFVVVGTGGELRRGVDMEIDAFIAAGAVESTSVVGAFRHAPAVLLCQRL